MTIAADPNLARLLQLASPALPVGAYSYSQGLEAAIEAGIVRDAKSAADWIGDLLTHCLAVTDAPVLLRLIHGWRAGDYPAVDHWNNLFLASRETAEFRAETVQMGYSLRKLMAELEGINAQALEFFVGLQEISFPTAFGFAAAQWNIPASPAVVAYLWAWVENQVMAVVKALPMGQTEGQRLLFALGERLPKIGEDAALLADDDLGAFAPRLAILSSRHETQYSRLFRS